LVANPHLRSYWHITSHYFFDKPYPTDADGKRIYYYSPQRFAEQFLNHETLPWQRDEPNYPHRMREAVLDLEAFKLHRMERDEITQTKKILRMFKAAGHESQCYGIGPGAGLFQACWNFKRYELWSQMDSREQHREYDLRKLQEYQGKLMTSLGKYESVIAEFNDELDAWVVDLYMPYHIPSLDSWQWEAWQFYAEVKIAGARYYSGGKPVYAFVQPTYTAEGNRPGNQWSPIQEEIWHAWLDWLYDTDREPTMGNVSPQVDRIYIFALQRRAGAVSETWHQYLIHGPGSYEGTGGIAEIN